MLAMDGRMVVRSTGPRLAFFLRHLLRRSNNEKIKTHQKIIYFCKGIQWPVAPEEYKASFVTTSSSISGPSSARMS